MKIFYVSMKISTPLPRSPGGPGLRLLLLRQLLRRMLTSFLMSCCQLRPRPLARSSLIHPGPHRAPHPLLYILRHYPSVSPADLGGLRLPIHPHSTLLPHPLQTRPLALSSIHPGPRRVLTMHRPLLRVLSLE